MSEYLVSIVRVTGRLFLTDDLDVLVLNNGKTVVTEHDEISNGAFAIFINSGSWIPHDWAPWMANYYTPRVSDAGIIGYHVKPRKIQGIVSDGIILSLDQFPVWRKMVIDSFLSEFECVVSLSKKNTPIEKRNYNDVTEHFGELAETNCNVFPYIQHKNHSISEYLKISKGRVQ